MIELTNFYFNYLKSFGYNVSRLIPLPDNKRDGTSFFVIQIKPIDSASDMCKNKINNVELSIIHISDTIRSYDVVHKKLKTVQQLIELLPYPTGSDKLRIHSVIKYQYEELGLDTAQRYAVKLKCEVFYSEY